MKHILILTLSIFLSCHIKSVKKEPISKEDIIKIAERAFINKYGERKTIEKRPFIAKKINDTLWEVRGTLHKIVLGGVPYAIINTQGKILNISHGK